MGAAEISGHAGKPTGGLSLHGGERVRNLQAYLHPDSEHWLDRIHITMRITVLQQQVKLLRTNSRRSARKWRENWRAPNISSDMATRSKRCSG
jgi:hypothetical protein